MTTSTILITGTNRGIGLELTRQFAASNWRVLACCRQPQHASDLQALAAQYSNIELFELDVTDYAQVAALSDQLKDTPIDILLSNAGSYGPKGYGFGDVNPQAWRNVLETNTIAPLMLAQAFVSQVAASRQKLIAVISSKVGSIADNQGGGGYIYRSSKTAVNQVVKSLSVDLAPMNISVVSLHPGWVQTEMGGPNALISTTESVNGLQQILLQAGPDQSGQFLEYNGNTIPW
ncbi:SDR family oxidoreductase [Aliamphritea spongicola]|uniref:SDR family oxidoreductase n=1 Tax=Aliamphritea spongicola TaxID=707589 RepID=UPI00196A3870|nr:SDR family oxidoreductase [Aliamphritea spongicola]MBN3562521.1 SDR family oxidoreductase [Aliamphritea spongicola]